MTARLVVLALALALALVGCSGNPPPIDPDDAARLACILAGGRWVDGRCIMPPPPPPPPPDPCDKCTAEQKCVNGKCQDPDPPPPAECVEESRLVVARCAGPVFHSEVKAATAALGDLTGLNPNDNLDTLAAQLRTQLPGRCILSGIEALFILRDDGLYEENHAVFFENGSWTNSGRGKFKYCHRNTGSTPEQKCAPPLPGTRRRMLLHCPKDDPRRKWCDHTPSDGDLARCQAIGLGCMPGTGGDNRRRCVPRNDCPPQTEGHALREACESEFYGWPSGQADPTWSSDGRIVMKKRPDGTLNRAMAYTPNGTWIKVCARDGTCGKVSR